MIDLYKHALGMAAEENPAEDEDGKEPEAAAF